MVVVFVILVRVTPVAVIALGNMVVVGVLVMRVPQRSMRKCRQQTGDDAEMEPFPHANLV